MSAEREAAIRARLATWNRWFSDTEHSEDVAYLLALADRQATALDAVRELADEWGADRYRDIEATEAADAISAALAAADDGGTRGRRTAADGSQGHSGACDGDQGASAATVLEIRLQLLMSIAQGVRASSDPDAWVIEWIEGMATEIAGGLGYGPWPDDGDQGDGRGTE